MRLQSLLILGLSTACQSSWEYADKDGDGHVGAADCWESDLNPSVPVGAIDHGVTAADIYVGAVDLPYDGIDANCDGLDDFDQDGDGFVPDIYVGIATLNAANTGMLSGGDCDDENPLRHPDTLEICDGIINACVDELPADEADVDGDGYVECSIDTSGWQGDADIVGGDDCDNNDALLNPDTVWYLDRDGDGFGDLRDSIVSCEIVEGYALNDQDCDDQDPTQFPSAPELCDGIVNDCGNALPSTEIDDDGDGYVDCIIDVDGWDGIDIVGGNDCDDSNPAIFPNLTFFADIDSDGFGDPDNPIIACSLPVGYVEDNRDCLDSDSTVFPNATELCDGQDNNCDNSIPAEEYDDDNDNYVECSIDVNGWDGAVNIIGGDDCDDSNPVLNPSTVWYADADVDGFGDVANTQIQCTQPNNHVLDNSDCLDIDPSVHPNATELCDGLDNNCDNAIPSDEIDADGDGYVECSIDEFGWDGAANIVDGDDCDDTDAVLNPSTVWYADADVDGFGDVANTQIQCTQPNNHVLDNSDCLDSDPSVHPNATEICDGLDNDCNNSIPAEEYDDDNDNYVECSIDVNGWDGAVNIIGGDDCDDTDLERNPLTVWYADVDVDGFGDVANTQIQCTQPANHVLDDSDCLDSDPSVNPNATELCDGQDNNCDNALPDDESDLDNDNYVECYIDNGGWDGAVNIIGGNDCDDSNPIQFPNQNWYLDSDGDGFGDTANVQQSCGQLSGRVHLDGDCADTDITSYPGADELCDGVDNDCDNALPDDESDLDNDDYVACSIDSGGWDGAVNILGGDDCDDDSATYNPATVWYADVDVDGFGDVANTQIQCTQPNNHVLDNSDCLDSDPSVNPNAAEICDGLDNNCDQNLLSTEQDYDGDNHVACIIDSSGWDGAGNIIGGNDCDESDPQSYGGAPELCDGIDNDCDNALPDNESDLDGDNYVECTIDGGGWDGAINIIGGDDCNDDNSAINVTTVWYIDTDGDAQGSNDATQIQCTQPNGYALVNTDCDDTDPTVYLGAQELCDGIDNDCDQNLLSTEQDYDGDNHVACIIDGGGWDGAGNIIGGNDCDESDPQNYGGAPELCDGIDNDCDNALPDNESDLDGDNYVECTIDSGGWDGAGNIIGGDDCNDGNAYLNPTTTWYLDNDGDNYGDANSTQIQCTQPNGYVSDNTDCDDSDEFTFPGAAWKDDFFACLTDVDDDDYGEMERTCITLNMTDSFGDGWQGNGVTLELDGNPTHRWFLGAGYSGSDTYCFDNDGSTVELVYDDGAYTSEIGFTLIYDGATIGTASGISSGTISWGGNSYSNGATFYASSVTTSVGTDCDDNDAVTFPGAAFNDSVYDCLTDADDDDYGEMSTEVCYTIEMLDNAGDGWQGNGISVKVDGMRMTRWAESGRSSTSSICIPINVGGVDFVFDDGSYETEISFDIYEDGVLLGSGYGNSSSSISYNGVTYSNGATIDSVTFLGSSATDCDDTDEFTFPGAAPNDDANECLTDVDGDDYGAQEPFTCFDIYMSDTAGNGWEGSGVTLKDDGNTETRWELGSGSYGEDTYCVSNDNSTITFTFDDGFYENEIGFLLFANDVYLGSAYGNGSNNGVFWNPSPNGSQINARNGDTFKSMIVTSIGSDSNDNNAGSH